MLKKLLMLALLCGLALPVAAAKKKIRDRITLISGEVLEGQIMQNDGGGYQLKQGHQERYIAAATVKDVQWDTDSRKWPWAAMVGGGTALPLAPAGFTDGSSASFSVGAGLGFLVHPRFTLQGDFDYSHFALNQAQATQGLGGISSIEGGDTWLGTALISARVYPFTRLNTVAPYVMAGAGFYDRSTRFLEIVTSTNALVQVAGSAKSGAALALGAGAEIFFTQHLGAFVELRWLDALDGAGSEALNVLPVRGGLSFRYGNTDPGTTSEY